MTARPPPDLDRLRWPLWLAQVGTVLLLSALSAWLPDMAAIAPLPALQTPLLGLALAASVALFFITRRLAPRVPPAPLQRWRRDAPPPPAVFPGRYVVALALCEIPVILGLVSAMTGGRPDLALGLGAVSLLLLWGVRPAGRGA